MVLRIVAAIFFYRVMIKRDVRFRADALQLS